MDQGTYVVDYIYEEITRLVHGRRVPTSMHRRLRSIVCNRKYCPPHRRLIEFEFVVYDLGPIVADDFGGVAVLYLLGARCIHTSGYAIV